MDDNVYSLICPKNAAQQQEVAQWEAIKALLPNTLQQTLRLQGRIVIVAIPEPPDGKAQQAG